MTDETIQREMAVFIGTLSSFGRWVKAFEFLYPERVLRAMAAASGGAVISGQQGYKLTRLATPEERRHAANWLRHQAAAMNKRAAEIETLSDVLEGARQEVQEQLL